MDTLPTEATRKTWFSSRWGMLRASSHRASQCSATGVKARPSWVGSTERAPFCRSNRRKPSSSSKVRIRRLRAGWEINRDWAAWEKLPVRVTARKACSSNCVIVHLDL